MNFDLMIKFDIVLT